MRKKSFTLLEVVIVVIIIGVLATLGIPGYQNIIEDQKTKVCEANLRALQTALNIYAMEHDTMPGDLSQIPSETIKRAYASVLKEKGAWKIKLARFILQWQERGLAYAQPLGLKHRLAGGNEAMLTCPADTTPPAQGGVSYGLNSALRGMTSREYRALARTTVLIGDSDSAEFTGGPAAARHRHYNFMSGERFVLGSGRGLIGRVVSSVIDVDTAQALSSGLVDNIIP